MGMSELIGKRVILELKGDKGKYFGTLTEIDESPKVFSWIIIKDRSGKLQTFVDSELIRIEEDR